MNYSLFELQDLKEEEKVTDSKVSIGSKSAKNAVKESTKESKSKSSDKSNKLSKQNLIPGIKNSNLLDDESEREERRKSKSSKYTIPTNKTKVLKK